MNKKKAIIIGAIGAAVVAVAVIICLIFVFKKDNDDEFTSIMDGIGEIQYVEYTYGKKTYVIKKENGVWMWEHNPNLLVEQEAVESRIQKLSDFITIDKFGKVKDLKEYGLDDPFHTVTFKDSKGNKKIIYIGDNLMDDSYYATTKNKKDVYVITSDIIQLIDDLDAQRDYSETIDALSTPTEWDGTRNYDE